MNILGNISPTLDPAELAAGDAPPTPPHEDALSDIYGPESLASIHTSPTVQAHEILSDLPSRQRALDTDAYREGIAQSKSQFVQEGFDEGYSFGANLGLQSGLLLGILRGFAAALVEQDAQVQMELGEIHRTAQRELAIDELLGRVWVDEKGVWNWDIKSKAVEPTLSEVAEQHPVIRKWKGIIDNLAARWSVDLKAAESIHETHAEHA